MTSLCHLPINLIVLVLTLASRSAMDSPSCMDRALMSSSLKPDRIQKSLKNKML